MKSRHLTLEQFVPMKCKCLLLRVLVLEFEMSFSFVCSSSNLVSEVAIELLLLFFPAKSTHSKTLFTHFFGIYLINKWNNVELFFPCISIKVASYHTVKIYRFIIGMPWVIPL